MELWLHLAFGILSVFLFISLIAFAASKEVVCAIIAFFVLLIIILGWFLASSKAKS